MGNRVDVRLVNAIRDNLAETYMALGMAAERATASRTDERWMVLSPLRHPVSNFAARFNLSDQGFRELCAIGRRSKHFRVYVCDGDEPETLRDDLLGKGAQALYSLTTMASDAEGGVNEEMLQLADGPEELDAACDLVVRTFFRRSEPWLRQHMKSALRSSVELGHEFWFSRDEKGVAAVVTLVSAGGVLGLYNLCVREDLQGRGVGSAVVRQVLNEGARRKMGIALQCEPSLAGWYRKLGFEVVGLTTAFSFDTR